MGLLCLILMLFVILMPISANTAHPQEVLPAGSSCADLVSVLPHSSLKTPNIPPLQTRPPVPFGAVAAAYAMAEPLNVILPADIEDALVGYYLSSRLRIGATVRVAAKDVIKRKEPRKEYHACKHIKIKIENKGETQDLVGRPKKRYAEVMSEAMKKESEEPVPKRRRGQPPKRMKGLCAMFGARMFGAQKNCHLGHFLFNKCHGEPGNKIACDLTLGHLLDLITDNIFPRDETKVYLLRVFGYFGKKYVLWKTEEERKAEEAQKEEELQKKNMAIFMSKLRLWRESGLDPGMINWHNRAKQNNVKEMLRRPSNEKQKKRKRSGLWVNPFLVTVFPRTDKQRVRVDNLCTDAAVILARILVLNRLLASRLCFGPDAGAVRGIGACAGGIFMKNEIPHKKANKGRNNRKDNANYDISGKTVFPNVMYNSDPNFSGDFDPMFVFERIEKEKSGTLDAWNRKIQPGKEGAAAVRLFAI
ncbi:hypothetical protein BDK51DRAFT_29346 [Blyttiomyces helicus]|uniref:Uncharacterized protein n=1 Tax=Blyttiomyces helicus TaxID=388810 RepID=A0A4P9WQC4_9FUNG|nr:hypothetical protein BDK51DRAFT_29346 [Blyttiomyces helicus]|eukprot:RKO94363.1 hypothetical protein BDK51DRAFT_29346 [Blyttiomyces helicus]